MFKTPHTDYQLRKMVATRWSEKILHLKGRAALNASDGKGYGGNVRYACCDRWSRPWDPEKDEGLWWRMRSMRVWGWRDADEIGGSASTVWAPAVWTISWARQNGMGGR